MVMPSVSIELANEVHDFRAGLAVEVAGGFIRQQELRLIDQRPSQRGSLLLAARKFGGAMPQPGAEADSVQRLLGKSLALGAIHFRKAQRQLHVFQQSHAGNQVERLKHHAHRVQAIFGQLLARELCQIAFLNDHGPGGWTIKPGDEIQQRRFAGARSAEQRDKLPGSDLDGDAIDGADQRFAHAVVAAQILGANCDRVFQLDSAEAWVNDSLLSPDARCRRGRDRRCGPVWMAHLPP